MPADILAIIPFYKRQDQLDRCLAALAASTHPIDPYVHDNNVDNVGFTRACNLGLRESIRRGHKYAILLNQDCYVEPDAVAKAIDFMDAHPKCAIAGPKQLRAESPDLIIHGGCTDAFPAGRHIVGKVSNNDCAVSLPMPWVNGACMVVRVDAILDFGLMDEGYFLIASDSDFCFCARQRGWEVWYCAESVVMHEGGGISSVQRSLDSMAHFNRDQLRFRDKWVGSMGWEALKQMPPQRDLTPQEIQTVLAKATTHYNKNELPHAELTARQLLAYAPGNVDALLVLARVHLRLGTAALAAYELKTVVEATPDSAQTHLAMADALVMSGFHADAIPHYRKARELGINNLELYNNLGVALASSGDKPAAIEEWRNGLKLDPNNEALRKNLTDNGAQDLPPPRPQTPPPPRVGR
jgi:GT2 family glycosyltransferase